MPVKSDDPLRRVTLNLYEKDCIDLKKWQGHGWTTYIRDLIHSDLNKNYGIVNRLQRPRILGDLK